MNYIKDDRGNHVMAVGAPQAEREFLESTDTQAPDEWTPGEVVEMWLDAVEVGL